MLKIAYDILAGKLFAADSGKTGAGFDPILQSIRTFGKKGIGFDSVFGGMRNSSITNPTPSDATPPSALIWIGTIPSAQGSTYSSLKADADENLNSSMVGQTGTTVKNGNYTITGISGKTITFNYNSPTGLTGLPTQKKDTIRFTVIDLAGNSATLSLITNSLA